MPFVVDFGIAIIANRHKGDFLPRSVRHSSAVFCSVSILLNRGIFMNWHGIGKANWLAVEHVLFLKLPYLQHFIHIIVCIIHYTNCMEFEHVHDKASYFVCEVLFFVHMNNSRTSCYEDKAHKLDQLSCTELRSRSRDRSWSRSESTVSAGVRVGAGVGKICQTPTPARIRRLRWNNSCKAGV